MFAKDPKLEKIRQETKAKVIGYIVAAFGLVAALAWNEAIKALIDKIYPLGENSLPAKFFYALIITIVVVIVSTYAVRLSGKGQEDK